MLCKTERRHHSYGAMIAIAEGADAIKEVAMRFVQISRSFLILNEIRCENKGLGHNRLACQERFVSLGMIPIAFR